MSEKQRKTSKQVSCNLCGRVMFARGLGAHIRMCHNTADSETVEKLTELIKEQHKFLYDFIKNGVTQPIFAMIENSTAVIKDELKEQRWEFKKLVEELKKESEELKKVSKKQGKK